MFPTLKKIDLQLPPWKASSCIIFNFCTCVVGVGVETGVGVSVGVCTNASVSVNMSVIVNVNVDGYGEAMCRKEILPTRVTSKRGGGGRTRGDEGQNTPPCNAPHSRRCRARPARRSRPSTPHSDPRFPFRSCLPPAPDRPGKRRASERSRLVSGVSPPPGCALPSSRLRRGSEGGGRENKIKNTRITRTRTIPKTQTQNTEHTTHNTHSTRSTHNTHNNPT